MSLKSIFNKDRISRVLISIALALLLWVVAMGNTNPEITKTYSNIPITLLNPESLASKELTTAKPTTTITLQLSGSATQMAQIRSEDIRANVDLSVITTAGSYDAAINLSGIPSNITIIGQRPTRITLDVYTLLTKSMNFTIENVGQPSAGYALMSAKPDVTIVQAQGSALHLNNSMVIRGELSLADRNDDFSADVALKAYDQDGSVLDDVILAPAVIKVDVEIGKSKEVPILVKTTGECAADYFCKSVKATPDKITIAAKEAVLESIDAIQLLDVDITGLDQSFSVVGTPIVPKGVTVLAKEPIDVALSIVEVVSVTYSYDKFQILNTPPGLTASVAPSENITLTLVSEPGVTFTKDDVKLSIDLTGLQAGSHQVDIKFELPSNVYIKEKNRSMMTVTLKEP